MGCGVGRQAQQVAVGQPQLQLADGQPFEQAQHAAGGGGRLGQLGGGGECGWVAHAYRLTKCWGARGLPKEGARASSHSRSACQVDARDRRPALISGMPQKARLQAHRGQRGTSAPADAGLQQRPLRIVVGDAGDDVLDRVGVGRAAPVAVGCAVRRNRKLIVGPRRRRTARRGRPSAALSSRPQARSVAMPTGSRWRSPKVLLTSATIGGERAVFAVRVPEAHRLEHVAEHARDRSAARPRRRASATPSLVSSSSSQARASAPAVAVISGRESSSQPRSGCGGSSAAQGCAAQSAHRQHQEVGGVGGTRVASGRSRVWRTAADRRSAPVPGLP